MSSFGETLKRERELRQISLREISEATKINLRYLDALEKNEFRHLPGGVFNKGFIRAFAQYIGIDPEAMVESYLEELRRQDARTQEKERGRRTGGERRGTRAAEEPPSRKGLWIAVAVILVLAAAAGAAVGISLLRRSRGGPGPLPSPSSSAAAPETADATNALPGEERAVRDEEPPAGAPAAPPPVGAASPDGSGSLPPAAAPQGTVESAASAAPEDGLTASIVLERAVRGSIFCDGKLAHDLESLSPGARIEVRCPGILEVDADDGGALRIGVDGADPVRVGADGNPLVKHRVEAAAKTRESAGGTP